MTRRPRRSPCSGAADPGRPPGYTLLWFWTARRFTVLPPLIEKQLIQASEKHAELERLLSDPDVVAQPSRFRAAARECGAVGKLVSLYGEYRAALRELEEHREIARGDDHELGQLAKEDLPALEEKAERLAAELTDRILVDDRAASRSVILEIRAGTGGDEAALFAADLFRMYAKFAERSRWKVEVMDAHPTELGGYREIIFSVAGEGVHRQLRYEMGGHRVQRVPETEASGRIHTSAATVAVMSEPEEVEVEINESDLRVDFYRAGGPGGQKVNKTSSAVRITHLPTGIVVAIQDEVSQHKNRAKAMRVMRSRLFDHFERQRFEKEQSVRRGQIGSGDRNQRIRTYNFPQNRVTDHRIGKNFNLERIIEEGDLSELIESLRGCDREQRLKELKL
ncbi:MAG: peptide chain release factor 1 [Planctomycetes bacterium]|nr:peptide chain release factor 1 [Planctomycetota bacterium]